MSKPKAPAAPDPRTTAAAQTGTNVSTAVANAFLGNVNQNTPDGSLRYDQTGSFDFKDPAGGQTYKIPRFTATQTLSPEQQRIQGLNTQTQQNLAGIGKDQSARIGSLLGTNLSFDGLPELARGPIASSYGDGTGMAARDVVENALMARMNPQLARDQEALRTSLVNQGVTAGSQAYDAAMADAGRQRNDARLGAILGAGQEQSLQEGIAQNRAAFRNQAQAQAFGQSQAARSQGINERLTVRNQPMNEISALMSGSQVAQPNFVNAQQPQIPTTDYAALVNAKYGQQMNAYSQKNQNYQALMGGLFGLGAAGIRGF